MGAGKRDLPLKWRPVRPGLAGTTRRMRRRWTQVPCSRYTRFMSNDVNTPPARGRGIYLLPNLFTTGGLFAGFFAIIAASQGRFTAACIAIFVAGILDGIAGRVARVTNTQAELGGQTQAGRVIVGLRAAAKRRVFEDQAQGDPKLHPTAALVAADVPLEVLWTEEG